MKIESIDSEEAKLYYEHYEVVQFVNNELHPAADAWAKEKLRKSLNTIVAQLKADGQAWRPSDGDIYLAVYPDEAWYKASENGSDVAAFLRLEPDFKDRTRRSSLGITCHGAKGLVRAMEEAITKDPDKFGGLQRAHHLRKTEHFYRYIDWFDDYEDFDEMGSALAADLDQLLDGLRDVIKDAGITPA
ncbi:MAG TPA: hypothetical protein RMH85_27935 [Polyangiaceae bacterium LLY-WYZ-15_(1-7)]|nr:hypothetical protein [Sandaracinus sp.]HJK94038.1 hypothetical protein [Polyangiaceae bacterium LLY-WYZ-15_(1-7)]HJL06472.1 hypothetical protein [Polyangiaceae bacterium LLY-WYZ-15_(1-7)]HJL12342.1 hypothetical protein [Polyangiaceae bacterium LLY-WYZ-15_(1-7)]HJL24761.1 hypothetical protein [Polyangiaceae bacterium LLY-WYZ-15_(1-7)]